MNYNSLSLLYRRHTLNELAEFQAGDFVAVRHDTLWFPGKLTTTKEVAGMNHVQRFFPSIQSRSKCTWYIYKILDFYKNSLCIAVSYLSRLCWLVVWYSEGRPPNRTVCGKSWWPLQIPRISGRSKIGSDSAKKFCRCRVQRWASHRSV